MKQNPQATLADFAPHGSRLQRVSHPQKLLEAALKDGRALFLLDGLDEVIDTNQQRIAAQAINDFARGHPRCRLIVTSRPASYREARLSDEFAQFTISPFDAEDIRRFVENWYGALQEPDAAPSLIANIERTPAIQKLASNPLQLTLIALIHHRRAKLPHNRAKLYRLASETLIDQWTSARRVTPEDRETDEISKRCCRRSLGICIRLRRAA